MRTTTLTTTVGTALATAAVAAVALAGAAHADEVTRTDPRDTTHGSDLLSVRVAHHEENVVVVTEHHDLDEDPASGSGGMVYLDTDPEVEGPEYVVVGGYFVGTDYVLLETDGFGPRQWGQPVEVGTYEQRVRYGAERVRTVISRESLGHPEQVRVAVRASGPDGEVDWVGGKRSLGEWVARG